MQVYAFDDYDFTGEAFFSKPTLNIQPEQSENNPETKGTMPPVKKIRLTIQNKLYERRQEKNQFAPTLEDDVYSGEVETSEYALQDKNEQFDDYKADSETEPTVLTEDSSKKAKKQKKEKKKKQKQAESKLLDNMVLDCDEIDYDTPNYVIYARGNVNVLFVKQETTLKADLITYDRMNNTIKAEGNVRIIKNGNVVNGDYIFIDMNEENALIENPISSNDSIVIHSKKGYLYGDKSVQEDGIISVKGSYPLEFHSAKRGPRVHNMLLPPDYEEEEYNFKLKTKTIKITQKGDLETLSISKGKIFRDDKVLLKIPSVKFYTNKNHDYVESNIWEIGSYGGFGMYTGPGFVFELPKGSVFKAMPILNYKSGFGVGAYGRFSSGTNKTFGAYGTATSRFMLHGEQALDDNLFMEYAVNSYMHDWFLGRRRPKYGVGLIYKQDYRTRNFLLPDKSAFFSYRLDGGYYHDCDFNSKNEDIKGSQIGTTRFRFMANSWQGIVEYANKEKEKSFSFGVLSQLSAGIYGTGDTQVIGRVGPAIHSQYKRWMQDIVYFFSAYDDNTPMPVFDCYRYGKQNIYLREYFRVSRYLTLSWFSSINMTGDAPNDKTLQENAFYITFGPDAFKLNLGYDWIRERLYCMIDVKFDASDSSVEYKKLEIKQDKKATETKQPKEIVENKYSAPTSPKVLQRAVVENLQVKEDVI